MYFDSDSDYLYNHDSGLYDCRYCGASESRAGRPFHVKSQVEQHERNCAAPPPLPRLDRHAIGTRDILLLGEGNFSFAVAFCKRHPWLCSQVVATDICVRRETGRKLGKVTASNIGTLEALGVLVGELDASRLPSGCTFSRVQFNCPCGDHATPIPKVVDRLFAWCRTGLTDGGTVHISCHGKQWQAQHDLMLPSIVRKHGFELHNTNDTLQDRYPGYTATRTNGGAFQNNASHLVTEYVFHIGAAGVWYTTHGSAYTIYKVYTQVVEPQKPISQRKSLQPTRKEALAVAAVPKKEGPSIVIRCVLCFVSVFLVMAGLSPFSPRPR